MRLGVFAPPLILLPTPDRPLLALTTKISCGAITCQLISRTHEFLMNMHQIITSSWIDFTYDYQQDVPRCR